MRVAVVDDEAERAGLSAGQYGRSMLDRVTLRVAHHSASRRFYQTTLGALEIELSGSGPKWDEWGDFVIVEADEEHPPTRNLHLGFVAPSRELVDGFWRAGTDAGYEDDGPPGERPQYTRGYYGAFLRDPDGNSAEAVHHADVRRGGHIDHLWVRVPDLDASVAFYTSLMPHVGLREGRRWKEGHQFRGAWATLSLVDDGAPFTEGFQIAFPAPDRETVEDFHRAAVDAGCEVSESPGERTMLGASRYSASVVAPDGARVESTWSLPR